MQTIYTVYWESVIYLFVVGISIESSLLMLFLHKLVCVCVCSLVFQCLFPFWQLSQTVIWRVRGGQLSHCTESDNYYPSFKDCLHCCWTGISFCSRSLTQPLLTNPLYKSWYSTLGHLYCGALKHTCLLPPRYLVMTGGIRRMWWLNRQLQNTGMLETVVSNIAWGNRWCVCWAVENDLVALTVRL